ncbi:translation initiation factor eIF2B subunit gamma-like [Lineus longissimus]|uniref:translation initiation factor eIF2B subunit gamma-like n=1 Tax=Lineus longissimus TaxID=88925 RepID=UPI002B4DA3FC
MMEFQPVVMAGGRGSRMTDLTAKIPKAILPVGNMPMVWYPVNMLERAGFEEMIIVVLKSQRKQIERALVEQCQIKAKLDFVGIPDDDDWGTADSLRHIKDKIKCDLLVVSCDLIGDFSLNTLADVHRAHGATVTALFMSGQDSIADMAAPGPKSKKKVELDFVGLDNSSSRLVFLSSEADFEETISFRKSLFKRHPCINIKTRLTDAHLYLMKQSVLDVLEEQRSISAIKGELIPYLVKKQFKRMQEEPADADATVTSNSSSSRKADVSTLADEGNFEQLARDMSSWNDHSGDMSDCYHGDKIRCYACIMEGKFCLRMNTLATYSEANRQIGKHLGKLQSDKEIPSVHPTATVQSRSQVGSECLIGENVTVAEKATVKKSNIARYSSIGEKVKITNSVVMDHVTIAEGCSIQGSIICDHVHIDEKGEIKDCIVGSGQKISAMGKFTNEVLADRDRMMEI